MKKITKSVLSVLLSGLMLASSYAWAVQPMYSVSSAYRGSDYYSRLAAVSLTGNYRTDILNVALSQTGYHEGDGPDDRDGLNMNSNGNYSEYGYFSSCDGYAWCAMFISWCARQAHIPESVIQDSRVARAPYFDVPFFSKSDYTPQAGDIIFFAHPWEEWSHVGLVFLVSDGYVYTVEGNASNMVRINCYSLGDTYIKGYGVYTSKPCNEGSIERGNICRIDYDLNGGGGEYISQYGLCGAPLCLYKSDGSDGSEKMDISRSDLIFSGWYVQRQSDGMWLTPGGWMNETDITADMAERTVISDGAALTIDSSWLTGDFTCLTFYAVWTDSSTGVADDESAFIYKTDSSGWANSFSDIDEADWFYTDVKSMVERGLFDGIQAHVFSPSGQITRAEFVSLLYRIFGKPAEAGVPMPYDDVPDGSWYYDAVKWACSAGILPPSSDSSFYPDSAISRQDMAAVMYRFELFRGAISADGGNSVSHDTLKLLLSFTDIGQVSQDNASAIAWAVSSGILQGSQGSNGMYLAPSSCLSRAECCTVISRYLSIVPGYSTVKNAQSAASNE